MGWLAFAFLIFAEGAVAVFMMGQAVLQWIADMRRPQALLGLGGQVLFALMPGWRVRGQKVRKPS